ncbi:MAG: U32 family peptidase [Lachnospiraceae bacterium]|nr:U32 family peptidase [Lachnospiraceae bacterium]
MKGYQVELLAPAGSKEAFWGAVNAGADAIYLAGSKYGARAYADNFSAEELIDSIRYAHLFGRKVYLTVNTLMKENELGELYDYLLPFYEAGLDACIVQDLGVFQCLKKWFPEMELHVSTQMTVTGTNGAEFLKELGASRIVPARELSLDEIRKMKEATGLEMETFIHGAMCYCYSGQCLFSSILGGRSGNRGRCAQPCRLPYKVDVGNGNSKECYPLSLKDMCTLEHIEALMDAGIDSFKIEGRMKKPEYAAGVTAIYRKYIDLKKKNPHKKLIFQNQDLEQLSKLYIRSERQDGYYFKQNGADMVTLENPAYSGSDDELLQQIRKKYLDRRLKKQLSIYASIIAGEKAFVMFSCEYLSVCVEGDIVEMAQNTPLSSESIEKQLSKLGDTCFELENIEITTDGQSFYSLKALNALRREAVLAMENALIEENGLCAGRSARPEDADREQKLLSKKGKVSPTNDSWSVVVTTLAQLNALIQYKQKGKLLFDKIYLESELILNSAEIGKILEEANVYIALPYCMRGKDQEKLDKLLKYACESAIKGFLVRNIEEYAYLKEKGYKGELCGDSGLYIWNKEALQFWKERLSGVSSPIELNRKEWGPLFEKEDFEKMVYGRIPMMITANCIAKTTDRCHHAKKQFVGTLTDRYNKQFPVAVCCTYCMNIVYNSVPLSLHKEVLNTKTKFMKKIVFTTENEQETRSVLNFYEAVSFGVQEEPPFSDYTTGHEKRGVE